MTHYLRPDVQIEPLVHRWHAHLMLIAPTTAALFLQAQLGILRSYLQMPMAHVAALRDAGNAGGPFVDLGGKRLDEVRALKDETERRAAELLALGDAIKALHGLLAHHPAGAPLAALYPRIPAPLQGLVELHYDLRHRADFRWIEPLVYRSSLYDPASQSVALAPVHSDERPFIFSTPRLASPGSVHLPLRFTALDPLYRLRAAPRPADEVIDELAIPPADHAAFAALLRLEPPRTTAAYRGDGLRVRYFGHACVLFETQDVSVLVDPLLSPAYASPVERFTIEDLPPAIDFVLLTHAHHDHLVFETLLELRGRIGSVVVPRAGSGRAQDPSPRLALEQLGFARVVELGELERLAVPGGTIDGLPFFGEHCDLDIRSRLAYRLSLAGRSVCVFADASPVSPEVYDRVRRAVGPADLMMIGLESTGAPMSWAYGPLFPDKLARELDHQRRSNGADSHAALRLAEIFACKQVLLYAMGLEPWLGYLMALSPSHRATSNRQIADFTAAATARGIATEALFARRELVFPPARHRGDPPCTT